KFVDDRTVEVYRKSEAWATNQAVWARIEFNQPIEIHKYSEVNGKEVVVSTYGKGDLDLYSPNYPYGLKPTYHDTGILFSRKVKKGEELLVKVSLSFTSFGGAELNSSEIPHWNFEKVKSDAKKT